MTILADSCCDLSPELLKKTQAKIAPLTITIDDTHYVDDGTVDIPPYLAAMKASKNPVRSACPSPDLYAEDQKFELGKGAVVREGSDVTVIACGLLVHKAIEAAEMLAEKGVSVRVVDMYSVKPIDRELIMCCAEETGAIVTAEEHNIYGGLGSAVSEVLANEGAGVPVEFVGIHDTFTESAPYKELLAKYGVDANAVARAVEKVMERK